MSQNDGIVGTVMNFLPGMTSTEDHKQSSHKESETHDVTSANPEAEAGGGILSYIPGFGGSSGPEKHKERNDSGDDKHTTRSGVVYGRTDDDTGGADNSNIIRTNNGDSNQPDNGYKRGSNPIASERPSYKEHDGSRNNDTDDGPDARIGAGMRGVCTKTSGDINNTRTVGSGGAYDTSKYNEVPSRYEGGHFSQTNCGNPEDRATKAGTKASRDREQGSGYDLGSGNVPGSYGGLTHGGDQRFDSGKKGDAATFGTGYDSTHGDNQQYQGVDGEDQSDDQIGDFGVKGTPIEGENVKGYAVSAPVGSGDTSQLGKDQDPAGQVSGAHMQYGPTYNDDRDSTGRGTVGTTVGDGDSSFANITRNLDNGSEHVTSHSSRSYVKHTSTTQL